MINRGLLFRRGPCLALTGPTKWQRGLELSNFSATSNQTVNVVVENGLPHFRIPLPSRRETCVFTVKPLQHTVGDLVKFIMSEDRGVDHVTFINKDGMRIARSNSIADLLTSDFHLIINNDRFQVDTSEVVRQLSPSPPTGLGDARLMITKLAQTVHSDEFQLQWEKELQRRIEDIHLQLEPFQEKRNALAMDAAKRTRRLTWLGLGAMGLQFGLLARLTWWEYSWDIMEPVTYFVGYGTSMAMYAYYVVTRQDYSFPQVFDREYLKHFYKSAEKLSFDVNRYNELCDQLAELKSELRRLRDPLYCNLPLQQTSYLVPERVEEIVAHGSPKYTNAPSRT
ncbi:Mitochondrial calcium uniporter [Fasciola hepatica]|uniref:Calcium uniporter protein n=1 Tax=Fasciola hepatica TaxID=6192 RepID=A0A4E0RUF3_FASHE|nr:Mitochondrial calcium uniporter [Fasciola hepatica]